MKNNFLPELPKSYTIFALAIALCVLRAIGIDSYTTAGLGMLIGYVTGKHIEQTRN